MLLLVDGSSATEHDTGPGHPERGERIIAIREAFEQPEVSSLIGRLERRWAKPVAAESLLRIHDPKHVEAVKIASAAGSPLDPDTPVSSRSYMAALEAAGAAVMGARAALSGRSSFCLTRPPGHHATPTHSMGFCLFNNVAVAAAEVLGCGTPKVAIVDFDVHHGNGTQQAFWGRDDVLYISLHQSPFYPGTGAAQETGCGKGAGFTVNIPLPAGSGDDIYLAAMRGLVVPVVRAYDPDILFLSAGYDGHFADPLGGLALSTSGFRGVVSSLRVVGGDARPIVACLEGGYDLRALAACVVATVAELAGDPVEIRDPWEDRTAAGPRTPPSAAEESGNRSQEAALEGAIKVQKAYWDI